MKSMPHSMQQGVILSVLVSCLIFCLNFSTNAGDNIGQDTLNRLKAATVQVKVEYAQPFENNSSWGTGFLVGPGLVMTNAHVVSDKIPTRVFVHNDYLSPVEARVVAFRYDTNDVDKGDIVEYIAHTIMKRARISGINLANPFTSYDVALLSFDPNAAQNLPMLAFSPQAIPNESVYAIGYPGADQPSEHRWQQYSSSSRSSTPVTVTAGRVRQVIEGAPRLVMHDALSKFGNSGGPVVNARGEVVGMQTWSAEADGQGTVISFALSGNDLANFVRQRGFVTGQPNAHDYRTFVMRAADAGDANFLALAGLFSFLGDGGFGHDHEAATRYLAEAINRDPQNPNAYLYRAGLAAVLARSQNLRTQEQAARLLQIANNSTRVGPGSRHPDNRLLSYEAALYMQGRAGQFPYNPNRSLVLAEKAMEDGSYAIPLALTGFLYYFGDSSAGRNHEMALENARESARNGITEGIALLAHMYYDSDAIPKNDYNQKTARFLAKYAADRNDPWALGLLANMYYESGDAGEREQAYELARRGLDSGNRLAAYCLGRMAWDAYLANPADATQAAKAWALLDLAEKRGVRINLPGNGGYGAALHSAGQILASLPADVQPWIRQEGMRELQVMGGIQAPMQ